MIRLLDINVGILLFFILLPVFGLVSLIVFLDLGSPVLFKQKRLGYRGKVFTIYKFRTMKPSKGNETDQSRITRISALIRSLRMDEIPQILNVIRGEMSFVGPRPLLPEYKGYFTEEENKRHTVLPGITGWAQVHLGNTGSWEQRFSYDLWYVEKKSLLVNMKILWMTLVKQKKKLGDGSEITPLHVERE
ncbi:sugar transferase [Halobacillus litoralis]|nr:sugar transferase [Halobacillus litoralis]